MSELQANAAYWAMLGAVLLAVVKIAADWVTARTKGANDTAARTDAHVLDANAELFRTLQGNVVLVNARLDSVQAELTALTKKYYEDTTALRIQLKEREAEVWSLKSKLTEVLSEVEQLRRQVDRRA